MKRITLTKGQFALVDDVDFDALNSVLWCCTSAGYAINAELGLMHRFIMCASKGIEVDHINGDPLDNQRANLRLATRQQQSRNFHNGWGKSRFKGLAWDRSHEAFAVRIKVDGRRLYLGLFRDEVEAARAYNRAAIAHFGEFAQLNPIDGIPAAPHHASRASTVPSRLLGPRQRRSPAPALA